MKSKQSIILDPPNNRNCEHCRHWKRHAPYDGSVSYWGKCTLKDVPRYMYEMHCDNGCNLFNSELTEKKTTSTLDYEQTTLF